MARRHAEFVAFLEREYKLTRAGAIAKAAEDARSPEERAERLKEMPAEEVRWYDFEDAMEHSPEAVLAKWSALKEQARSELESGQRACEAIGRHEPYERAQYLAVWQSLTDECAPVER